MNGRYQTVVEGDAVLIQDTVRDLRYHIGYVDLTTTEHISRLVARAFERGRKQRSRELAELIGDT